MAGASRVCAVVVAYERRELLAQVLRSLAAQSAPLERVVVVDNASSDGSAEVAERVGAELGLPLDVVRLPRNTGGAGGFAVGLATALAAGATPAADLLWVMDDDTDPRPTALEELLAARERWVAAAGASALPPVLLASRVVWHDGREHPMNTPRPRPVLPWARTALSLAGEVGVVPVRSASFVSCLLDAAAVRRHGLPLAAYFLWNDDFELTTRLLRRAVGVAVPGSVVVHRTKAFGAADADPGVRFRFEVRNKVWMFTRSASLAPWEKVLYGGSTLARWVRTVRASTARGVLLRAGAAGLVEAVRSGPPSTPAVLAGLGVPDAVGAAVAAVELGAGRAAR